ncbi:MAG: DoxX family protein, partial [Devosia sp.]|uniref:DoxX family protein n=1 Tax=Devosia sp. TaxID=1871048 RepID=UPI00262894F5
MLDNSLMRTAPWGALLLRVTLAIYWAVHWWYKVGFRGVGVTESFFAHLGLPDWLMWFDLSIEVLIFLSLLFGSFVRIGALVGIPILLASIWIYSG